jgi:hypothetical protein
MLVTNKGHSIELDLHYETELNHLILFIISMSGKVQSGVGVQKNQINIFVIFFGVVYKRC